MDLNDRGTNQEVFVPHLQSERQRSPGHGHGANSAKEIDKMHLPNSPNDLWRPSCTESKFTLCRHSVLFGNLQFDPQKKKILIAVTFQSYEHMTLIMD